VGDQGMPNSGYSSLFLGRRAWTSPLPALLSLRTGRPIIVATNRRVKRHYSIHYSDPIWPTPESTSESLMDEVLSIFEKTIEANPSQWLWIHNRWKQSLPTKLPKRLRQECILLIFPTLTLAEKTLPSFKKIYPLEFLTAFIPQDSNISSLPSNIEFKFYKDLSDILVPDYRFKLIYDFTHTPAIKKHFLGLSAFHVEMPSSAQDIIQWENHAS
jgi:KDO2-lipid IV(A) lauroyltransferase